MIYNNKKEDHIKTVEEVFRRLQEAGLSIAIDKCKFEKTSIDYLGYEVSSQGIKPLERKIDGIRDLPTPTKQKELLHYLGAVNYFRSSLGYLPPEEEGQARRSAAEILQPLYAIGTDKLPPKVKFSQIWDNSPALKNAFEDP